MRTLFDGPDVNTADAARLHGLLKRVFETTANGNWYTLSWLASIVGGSEASVSARLRDLRKPRFGGHTVERRRTQIAGIWEYRLIPRAVGPRSKPTTEVATGLVTRNNVADEVHNPAARGIT